MKFDNYKAILEFHFCSKIAEKKKKRIKFE